MNKYVCDTLVSILKAVDTDKGGSRHLAVEFKPDEVLSLSDYELLATVVATLGLTVTCYDGYGRIDVKW